MTEPDIHEAGSDTHEAKSHETEAELRISRVQALNGSDLRPAVRSFPIVLLYVTNWAAIRGVSVSPYLTHLW